MSQVTVAQVVAAALADADEASLQDIVAHGIHNITNDYHGNDDEQYEEFASEFRRQAEAQIASIEAARMVAFRALK